MFIIPFLAYLIGSIPSAYLIVRYFTGKNIASEGSGNVGAMNSYETTGKKYIGLLVFIADMLKGLLPVVLLQLLGAGAIEIVISGIALVLGHNFSLFLKLRGGKGLATAVGVFAGLNVLPILMWVGAWSLSYKLWFRDINKANIFATALLLSVFVMPDSFIYFFDITPMDPLLVRLFISSVAFLIMLKHIKDIKSIVAEKKS